MQRASYMGGERCPGGVRGCAPCVRKCACRGSAHSGALHSALRASGRVRPGVAALPGSEYAAAPGCAAVCGALAAWFSLRGTRGRQCLPELRKSGAGPAQEHAFLGLAALLRLNPEAALDAWTALCEALASWRHIRCEGLLNELTQLLHLYKANLVSAGRWERAVASLPPIVYEKLSRMFGI